MLKYNSIELHLNSSPEFTKKYGKKVKELKGTYNKCRGYSSERFVTIPVNEESKPVIQKIFNEFGKKKTTVIPRGINGPYTGSLSAVMYVSKRTEDLFSVVEVSLQKNLEYRLENGWMSPVVLPTQEERIAEKKKNLKDKIESLKSALEKAEAELAEVESEEFQLPELSPIRYF